MLAGVKFLHVFGPKNTAFSPGNIGTCKHDYPKLVKISANDSEKLSVEKTRGLTLLQKRTNQAISRMMHDGI